MHLNDNRNSVTCKKNGLSREIHSLNAYICKIQANIS